MEILVVDIKLIKSRPERQRKELAVDHIKILAESISQNGLFHAPVVNEELELIAGDCRRRAMEILISRGEKINYNGEELEEGKIPVVRTHKTSEKDLFSIELEENLRRRNLSQMEEAQAIAKLHELRKQDDPNWTNKQTAKELSELRELPSLGATEKEVADALILSHYGDDPEVKAARTKSSAVRIAKKKMEMEFRSLLGRDATGNEGDDYRVLEGNSLELLSTIPDKSFDGVITDPPYGMGADAFGGASFLGEAHKYTDNLEYATVCYEILATESFRICQDEAHLYAFCDILFFPQAKEIFTKAGWNVWKTPLIWYKGTTGHCPRPDHGPKRTYEAILFAAKGDKRVLKTGQDVLMFQGVFFGDKLHAAEKPQELLEALISWSFYAGEKILDPFCGSGSIFSAAKAQKLTALGIELDADNVGIARNRISNL